MSDVAASKKAGSPETVPLSDDTSGVSGASSDPASHYSDPILDISSPASGNLSPKPSSSELDDPVTPKSGSSSPAKKKKNRKSPKPKGTLPKCSFHNDIPSLPVQTRRYHMAPRSIADDILTERIDEKSDDFTVKASNVSLETPVLVPTKRGADLLEPGTLMEEEEKSL